VTPRSIAYTISSELTRALNDQRPASEWPYCMRVKDTVIRTANYSRLRSQQPQHSQHCPLIRNARRNARLLRAHAGAAHAVDATHAGTRIDNVADTIGIG
jgi:hypothetical protein